jgi:FtsP/CotA-like multicopper oxidase with cupredoxin domain
MSTIGLIAVDLTVALLCAAAWLGAGITAATGRGGTAKALTAGAVAVTLARVVVVVLLAGRGWWFVQDKVTFALPLLGLAAVVAVGVLVSRGASAATVPLLAAGFTATSGLLLPFFSGYPMRVDQALISISLIGAATLAAWRVTSPAPVRVGRFVAAVAAVGLAGAALGLLPAQQVDAGEQHHHHAVGAQVATAPAPGGQVRRFELAARRASVTLASGTRTEAWTYNGSAPGPEITATEGDLLEVTLTNVDIDSGVTLHWHGYDVPNSEDGAPGLTQDAVMPGGRYVYRFLANQVGTYWYHTHQASAEGVRKGLFGTLIVTPRAATPSADVDLTLPVHTFDGIVALGSHDGVTQKAVPQGTPVRLRVINTDSNPHRISLAGTAFRVVAVDGNDLHEPGEVSGVALRLAAGGRYDFAFSMPAFSMPGSGGGVALLVDDDPVRGALRLGDGAPTGTSPDTSAWPELDLLSYGSPLDAQSAPFGPGSRFDRDFTMVLDRGLAMVDGKPMYAHTVNGLGHPNVPTQRVREGDLVRFTVVNRGLDTHPWHLHGHRVLVLSKDGRNVSGSPLWLDTFDVRPGEFWRVALRANNRGVWMNHCHNLGHADQGMALHLSYDG